MLTPSLNTVMTRLLIVAAVLGSLVFVAPAIFAQAVDPNTIMFEENSTDAVRTFTSTDPEGAGIDWDVTGLDADFFSIDSRGMLMFNSPPDFESKKDKVRNDIDDVEGTYLGYRDAEGAVQTATAADDAALDDIPARDREFEGGDGRYQVTIRASEQETSGSDPRALSTETDVTVVVTDVNEPGTVSMNRIQPEVATPIMAMLDDKDGVLLMAGTVAAGTDDEVILGWQWYVSKVSNPDPNAENHWVIATGENPTTNTYTPAGDRVEKDPPFTPDPDAPVDEDKILRAVVTYLDMGTQVGDDNALDMVRKVTGVSTRPVRAEVSSDMDEIENPENGSPGFSSALDYEFTIAEDLGNGMPVGDPVVAIDPNGDELTYELDVDLLDPGESTTVDGTTVNDRTAAQATAADDPGFYAFAVDMATGQITVDGAIDADAGSGEYKVYVKAIDPSGETAHVEVTITVTDANDAPKIRNSAAFVEADSAFGDRTDPPTELRVNEKAKAAGASSETYNGMPDMPIPSVPGSKNVFTADDDDTRGQIFWDIKGEDVDDFELTSSSVDPNTDGLKGPGEPIALKFKNDPDYENPTDSNLDGVYKVTIVASDRRTGGLSDERSLTIFVDNVAEDGDAVLTEDQPLIGHAITASVEDPDNGVAVVSWQWERSPTGADTTWVVINGATTDTYVPKENKDAALTDNGKFLRARAVYTDITSYMDDLDTVRVDERTQKDTDDDGVPEARDPEAADDADRIYRVSVVSKNAVRVPLGEDPEVGAPEFAASSFDRMVAENAETDTIVGYPVTAVPELDDDGNVVTTFEYTLEDTVSGDDAYFRIDQETGQIRVRSVAFADPTPAGVDPLPAGATPSVSDGAMDDPTLDYEGKNTYELIVTAEDSDDDTRKVSATVSISLVDLNERPYFDKASRDTSMPVMYSEHRTNAVIPQLAAIDPDGQPLRWELTGTDARHFEIVDAQDIDDGKDRVQLMFKNQPDFETKGGADDLYSLVVRATEMSPDGAGPAVALAATLDVTVQVLDYDEDGMVEYRWLKPEVGTAMEVSVTDEDADTNPITVGTTWTWYRAKVTQPHPNPDPEDTTKLEEEWELITGASGTSYPPVAADEDKFLLARVTYNDGTGTEADAAVAISPNTVGEDVLPERNNSPDFNQSKTTRSIPEDAAVGTAIGDPVDVDRNEDGDILTYELVRTVTGTEASPTAVGDPGNEAVVEDDLAFFKVDKDSGQIRVNAGLNHENANGGKYTVVVRATDPSGEFNDENRDDIVVEITATDVEEAPTVTGGLAEITIKESNSTAMASDVTKFVPLGYTLNADSSAQEIDATNPNLYHRVEEDLVDRATWPDDPIPGPDGRLFEYSVPGDGIGRRLHFKEAPDYETPLDENGDNVYEVAVTVIDGDGVTGLVGSKNIRITVENVNEDGKLVLSPEQPDDGMPVIATLEDPDVVVSITNWMWATTTDSGVTVFPPDPTALPVNTGIVAGASMAEYTGSVGEFLIAKASYRDGASVMDHPVTALDERNDSPETDPTPIETNHDSDMTAEGNTENAVQPDPDPPGDGMTPNTGVEEMVRTVYENVPSTGYVGDPIEGLVIRNRTGTTVLADRDTIGGPDGDTFVFAEYVDHGDDLADATEETGYTYVFYDGVLAPTDPDIDGVASDQGDKEGQLALAPVTHLDYEASKNSYIIEIRDPDADIEVSVFRITINVMDVNEPPTAPSELKGPPPQLNAAPMFLDANGDVATSTYRMVAENTAAGTSIGDPVAAIDSDRGDQETVVYTLGGADAASFTIDSATGQLSTSAPLDFETKSEFMVTVTATDEDDASSMIYVTIMVTDVGLDTPYDADESGTIDSGEVLTAVADYFNGDIDGPTVLAVVTHYFAGL